MQGTMQGTDLTFEPTKRTFHIHISPINPNRKTRVYVERPSRQVLERRALRAAGAR